MVASISHSSKSYPKLFIKNSPQVGNGKLNPAAEAAIIEQNKREERLKEERAEKERKAARKAEKKKAQNGGWFDEGSAPKPAKKNW